MLTVVSASSFASFALADSKIIDMRDGFPSGPLPLGEAFSVALNPDPSATAAHGLFFEYANGVFGSKAGSEIDYCSQLTQVATPLYSKFQNASRGDTTLGEFFEQVAGPTDSRWSGLKTRRAFLLPSWYAPKTPPAEAQVPTPTLRVPATSFFQRGAHYCFIVVEEATRTEDSPAVRELLTSVVRTVAECRSPNGSQREKDACISPALARVAAAKRDLSPVARAVLRDNLGPALSVAHRQRAFVELLGRLEAKPKFAPSSDIRSPFGTFVAAALAANAPPECKPREGESAARFETAGGSFLVWKHAGTGTEDKRPCDFTKIPVGDARIADFLALAQGTVLVHGKQVSFGDLRREALAGDLFTSPEKFADDFSAVASWLEPVSEVLEGSDSKPEEVAARTWAASIDTQWIHDTDENPDGVSPGAVQVKTSDLASALMAWSPALATVAETVASFKLLAIDASIGLTPNTWVFSFLVPTVGYATTSDDFGIPIVALQLYAFPNAADEPMWTNGSRDWRRVLSLELGIVPKTDDFGPNDRFSGPGDLPPVVIGFGVHLIPYVTLSMGALLVDAKRSTLPEETATLHPLFYFSAALQANIPDIVASLITGKNTNGE